MPRSTTVTDNKPVFAGIDYHKRISVISLGNRKGELLEQHQLENDEHEVRKFFLRRAPLSCAIENCRGNEWIIDLLKKCGCEVHVSNTYALRLIADSKKKNDKIDSRILMELLARDYLPTCYQPTPEERALRERLRWRTKLMRSRTQYKNVAHSLMDKENKPHKLGSRKRRNQAAASAGLTGDRQERLGRNLEVIEFLEQRLSAEDMELEQLALNNHDVALLRSIPGVGPITGLMLVAELGDVSRFRNAKAVAAYLGLVPRLYATSDTCRLGRITKQGSGLVRRTLVQSAWMAIQHSKVLLSRYNSILKRRGKRIAIVAIARMLAEVAFRILRDKTPFDESKMTLG